MLAEAKFNTILAGVSWAQIEPQEGKVDFSVPDGIIRDARSHGLRLVLLWSSYPPDWLKKDFERFPRVQHVQSRPLVYRQSGDCHQFRLRNWWLYPVCPVGDRTPCNLRRSSLNACARSSSPDSA